MRNTFKKYLLGFLVLVYVCGTIGFYIHPDFFSPFTPYTLLLTAFVFLVYQPLKNRDFSLSFFALVLIGFFTEALGVKTAWIFGNYYYGETLGYKLIGVPLVISLNWAILISSGILVSSYLPIKRVFASVLSALLITGIDLLIEQVCSRMDFWYFDSGIAGLHNSIGWLIISFVGSYLFYPKIKVGNKTIALWVLLLQIFFFGFTFIIYLF